MSAPRLCKYGCGKELYWDVAKSKYIELDGTEHTKERCESLKTPKPAATPTTTDPLTELSAAIRELAAAIREAKKL